ncbi:hypothetical protein NLU13_7409 [Sarocladium strictum]|uniref:CCHC-type domain-containing protein n=1 Tax=Sarocladium strictum TaxID=5046 RepID=A0AA39GCS1_SARSR|nr:hypothetical protein NLU13_7409 [Sarocladium strictum]
MASNPHPGSVISIGSSSDEDRRSSGYKRAREDDSDDETSSSGSSRSRSESPGSRVDAVSLSRRKGVKRQKGIQDSVEAGTGSSTEEGEMSEDSPAEPVTGRVTRSQSRALGSPEKQTAPEASSQAGKASKKKTKKQKAMGVKWTTPEISNLGPSQSPEEATEAWCRDFINKNKANVKLLQLNTIRDIFLAQIPLSQHLSSRNSGALKKCIRSMKRGGRLTQILKEVRSGWERDPNGSQSRTLDKPGSSKDAMSIPSESEEEYEPTMGLSVDDTSKASSSQAPVANGTTSVLANGSNAALVKGIPTGEEEIRQQRRYFPSASDPSSMCLLCGRSGHNAISCPHLGCQFCSSMEHADFACPARARCKQCRQLGHASKSCTEKLSLTKDEGLACSFCAASDHLEQDCTEPWRSFHPEQEKIHTVTFIPPTCSSCGVEGEHYSGDCQNIRIDEVNPTWTLRNHDRYVDAQATDKSIEEDAAGALAGLAPKARVPEMKIRGHAKTQHIQFHDSDSETEFLGQPPAKRGAPIGQIRMSSNIQMPSESRVNNTRGRGPAHLPPLPPGPPPPGPPPPRNDGYNWQPPPPPGAPRYDTWPQGPPPSLPARPPAQNSYHHVPPPASHQQSSGGQSRQGGGGDSYRGGKNRNGKRGGGGGGGSGRGGGRGRGRGRGR